MAKVIKKGVKPTTKKAVAKKATATTKGRKAVVTTTRTTKGGTTITRKATEKKRTGKTILEKSFDKSPKQFTKGRTKGELFDDFGRKAKTAKKSANGKWYVEWVGRDGKKHREYRPNRMDYKFGI